MRLRDLSLTFLRLGATSFGGSMLPIMEEVTVQRNRWITPAEFTRAVTLAQITPGPIALKVAFSIGHSLRGAPGACAAAVSFALPSFLITLFAGHLLFHRGIQLSTSKVQLLLAPAVTGLFLASAWRLGGKCFSKPIHWVVAFSAFMALQLGLSPLLALWIFGLLGALWKIFFSSSSPA